MRSFEEIREVMELMAVLALIIFIGIFLMITGTIAECIIRALPYACVAALIYAAYRIALLAL